MFTSGSVCCQVIDRAYSTSYCNCTHNWQSRKEMDVDIHDPTTVTTIGAVATAATAAIGKLWYTVVEQHKDVRLALQNCEDEHEKARDKIDSLMEGVADLRSQVGHMQGLMEGLGCAVKKKPPQQQQNKG